MPDDEDKQEAEEPKATFGYLVLHVMLPMILLQSDTDIENMKNNFFSLLDNKEEIPIKNFFLGLCKITAEIAHERKYDLTSEADATALAEIPGFLKVYRNLLRYSIVEMKNKTKIYIWEFPQPLSVPEPIFLAVILLPEKQKENDAMIRYIVLEESYFGSMLCEWTKKGQDGECHINYGDCENDRDIFLDRVLKILDEDRESIASNSSYNLIENDIKTN